VNLADYTPVVRDLVLKSKETLAGLQLEGARVLDMAGGTGRHAKFYGLASRANTVSLVDFSREAVAAARSNGFEARRCNLECESLPYKNDHFDLVLAQEIVEHLSDCDHLIQEAHRVLRASGFLYLTTPNLAGLIDRIFLLRGKKPLAMAWDKTHIRLYTFAELEEALRRSGFEIAQSTTQGAYLCFRSRFFRLPGVARLDHNLGQHIMILARKRPAATTHS
jgi:ubiquinone/menaquinone biosynthesis C-methylase UbiE